MPPTARVRLPAARACAALLFAAGGLAACDQTPAPVQQPRVSTWRIVVFGADDATDDAARVAIGNELVHRGIATAIVAAEGPVDHILTVSITHAPGEQHVRLRHPKHGKAAVAAPIAAQETVSNGRDPGLTVQRVFGTGAPVKDEPPTVAADAVQSLAWQIGQTLSSAPVEPISMPGAGTPTTAGPAQVAHPAKS